MINYLKIYAMEGDKLKKANYFFSKIIRENKPASHVVKRWLKFHTE